MLVGYCSPLDAHFLSSPPENSVPPDVTSSTPQERGSRVDLPPAVRGMSRGQSRCSILDTADGTLTQAWISTNVWYICGFGGKSVNFCSWNLWKVVMYFLPQIRRLNCIAVSNYGSCWMTFSVLHWLCDSHHCGDQISEWSTHVHPESTWISSSCFCVVNAANYRYFVFFLLGPLILSLSCVSIKKGKSKGNKSRNRGWGGALTRSSSACFPTWSLSICLYVCLVL